MKKTVIITMMFTLMVLAKLSAQTFVDFTPSQLRIDSMLPEHRLFFALPHNHQDSIYSVRLLYPEYSRMSRKQRRRYRQVAGNHKAAEGPVMTYDIFTDRKNASLAVTFTPIVKHKGRLSFLKSFLPQLMAEEKGGAAKLQTLDAIAQAPQGDAPTYASSSVLATGKWAKVAVAESGIHVLSDAVIRKAGFTDISKVRIYGYGGNTIPERLTQDYLRKHDDLQPVASCIIGKDRYFYAKGPVHFPSRTDNHRIRNQFTNYGYYFITTADVPDSLISMKELLQYARNSTDSYHSLYEKDQLAIINMGVHFFDKKIIAANDSALYTINIPAGNEKAKISVAVGSDAVGTARVVIGGKPSDIIITFSESYEKLRTGFTTISIDDVSAVGVPNATGDIIIPVLIKGVKGSNMHLDYIAASFEKPEERDTIKAGDFPVVQYVGRVGNQNHHADEPADLIIIIPPSQKTLAQAQELAQFHLEHDGISSRIIPANELYNEFASGSPDMTAFKRYLKMFYDKCDADKMPKSVLLFGKSIYDNRRNFVSNNTFPVNDYLPCYETPDTTTNSIVLASVNEKYSIAADDYITILQDGKALHNNNNSDRTLQFDIAVGRLPVSSATEAQAVVNKIKQYSSIGSAGAWQNDIIFLADDGNNNMHAISADRVAEQVINNTSGFNVKKMYLDAYKRTTSASGNTYPQVSNEVRERQNKGTLLFNYSGHASPNVMADEKIVSLNDFTEFTGTNYSFWLTAGCETVPYDMQGENMGEAAVRNSKGGAVAFYGTNRTVLESLNNVMNRAMMKYLLAYDDKGLPNTIGEAQRLAKNDVVKGTVTTGQDITINKHHYTLIGDPAMRLAIPRYVAVMDSINDKSAEEVDTIKANSIVTLQGHITDRVSNAAVKDFNGTMSVIIRDGMEVITCRDNQGDADSPFQYNDRPVTLYNGNSDVVEGRFRLQFRVPQEITEVGEAGMATLFAISSDGSITANGETHSFLASGQEEAINDYIGPEIFAYLNTPDFRNGDVVGRTPFFVAEVSDNDGINATGASVGHNMSLIIDGKASMTYDLDQNFQFDYGSYTNGQTYYVLPELSEGTHTLLFRAWDLLNNNSTAELTFTVSRDKSPAIADITVTPNPVQGEASFIITSDMQGSASSIYVDIMDTSGRLMNTTAWNIPLSANSSRTVLKWNSAGLNPGLYLYRVRITCNDGKTFSTKCKKLIKI